MTIAAAQYARFREQVVQDERVFTFGENGEYLVYRVGTEDVIPFWSSRSRLETIRKRTPKYSRYEIIELPFAEFYRLLRRFEAEHIHIGVNWSGGRLTGYNVPVSTLREGLDYWIDQLGKRRALLPSA